MSSARNTDMPKLAGNGTYKRSEYANMGSLARMIQSGGTEFQITAVKSSDGKERYDLKSRVGDNPWGTTYFASDASFFSEGKKFGNKDPGYFIPLLQGNENDYENRALTEDCVADLNDIVDPICDLVADEIKKREGSKVVVNTFKARDLKFPRPMDATTSKVHSATGVQEQKTPFNSGHYFQEPGKVLIKLASVWVTKVVTNGTESFLVGVGFQLAPYKYLTPDQEEQVKNRKTQVAKQTGRLVAVGGKKRKVEEDAAVREAILAQEAPGEEIYPSDRNIGESA